MTDIPPLAHALCDDAAVFPPGLAPLPEAVAAHRRHRATSYTELVGPLVLSAPALAELAPLLDPSECLELAVTAPDGPAQLADAFATAGALPVQVRAVEVALPATSSPAEFFNDLTAATAGASVEVFVEIPRDRRRGEVLAGCAHTGHAAKFRTGGVSAALYPDEHELATAVRAVVGAGVAFKATAGLHHAIRNTDPNTGFEQHGFLNLLLAVETALGGGDVQELAAVLAERDGPALATRVAALDEDTTRRVRARFRSFGTCSITDPLADLTALGLLPERLSTCEGAVP